MEGAESTIVHLPEEEEDALRTKELVEEKGGRVWLIGKDLRGGGECWDVVERAREYMGGINVLVLNHGTQAMKEGIEDLSE